MLVVGTVSSGMLCLRVRQWQPSGGAAEAVCNGIEKGNKPATSLFVAVGQNVQRALSLPCCLMKQAGGWCPRESKDKMLRLGALTWQGRQLLAWKEWQLRLPAACAD